MSSETLVREVDHEIREVKGDGDDVTRYLDLSFSSEDPYGRWFGDEILGHKRGEVDLSRLKAGAPFLADHTNRISSILGRVDSVKIEERRGKATVKMADTAGAREYLQLLDSGMAGKISVGYSVNEMERVDNGKEDKRVYRVTSWMPHEISAVAVAADDTVGVGKGGDAFLTRVLKTDPTEGKKMSGEAGETGETNIQTKGAEPQGEAKPSGAALQAVKTEARTEVSDLFKYAADFGPEGEKEALEVVRSGGGMDELKDRLLAKRKGEMAPTTVRKDVEPTLNDQKDIQKFSLRKAILGLADSEMRDKCGYEIEVMKAANDKAILAGRQPESGMTIPDEVVRYVAEQDVMAQRHQRAVRAAALGDQTRQQVTNVDADGGYLVPDVHRGDLLIEALQSNAPLLALCRIFTGLMGNIEIPKETSTARVTWEAEGASSGGPDKLSYGQVKLTPKELRAAIEYSRKLLIQSSPQIDALIRNRFMRDIAVELSAVVIKGRAANSVKGVTDDEIGAHVFDNTGAFKDVTWSGLVELMTTVMGANALINGRGAFVGNPLVMGELMTTQKFAGSNGEALLESGEVGKAAPFVTFNAMPTVADRSSTSGADVIYGDWTQVYIGMWSGIDIQVNPYSKDLEGLYRVVAFQDVDIAKAHQQSFARRQIKVG